MRETWFPDLGKKKKNIPNLMREGRKGEGSQRRVLVTRMKLGRVFPILTKGKGGQKSFLQKKKKNTCSRDKPKHGQGGHRSLREEKKKDGGIFGNLLPKRKELSSGGGSPCKPEKGENRFK